MEYSTSALLISQFVTDWIIIFNRDMHVSRLCHAVVLIVADRLHESILSFWQKAK